MEKNLQNTVVIFGIICLLLFAIVPMVTATTKPSEHGGTSIVYIKGICYEANFEPMFILPGYGFQIGPLCWYAWSAGAGPEVAMENGSVFYVNGVKQDLNVRTNIKLWGFFGFAPTLAIWTIKALIDGIVWVKYGNPGILKIRIFGICREYDCDPY